MEEVVVDPDLDHHVCVLIQNGKGYPVKLKKGSVLGTVSTVKEVNQETVEGGIPESVAEPSNCVASIQAVASSQPTEREKQLLRTLHINQESLTKEESTQLEALILEYADVFAVDPSDLSTTDQITHSIETGDLSGNHQDVYHLPYVTK